MNNNNKFKNRGQALLDELKQFVIDVNSNTTNKQTQLNQILFEIKSIENKIETVKDDFLVEYRKIVGQEFANKPADFPKIMKMDGFLIKTKFNKNKQNQLKQLEINKLAENQRKANEAKTLNISKKTDFIKSEIKRLRENIGNVNTNNNQPPPLNIFANKTVVRPPNQSLASNVARQRIANLLRQINTSTNKTNFNRLRQSVNALPNSNNKTTALAKIKNKLNLLQTARNAGL
jgi:hypothetical protein